MPLRLPANLRRPEHEDPESLAAIFVKGSSKSEGRGEGEGGNALPLLSNLPKKPHLFSRKGPKKGRTFAVLPPRPLLDSSQSRRGSRDSHPTASSPWDRRRTDTVKEGGKQTPSYVGVIKGDEAIAGWQTPEQERSSSKAMTTLATKHGPTRTDAIKKWADRLYLPAVLTRQWCAASEHAAVCGLVRLIGPQFCLSGPPGPSQSLSLDVSPIAASLSTSRVAS